MSRRYCVIGKPVRHSLSPLIHNTLYRIYHLDCVYHAQEVDCLPAFLQSLQADQIHGFNVTMPYKEEILPFLAQRDASVTTGANTIVVREGKLHGFSTDAQGFHASLRSNGRDYANATVCIIGAGSVGRLLQADALRLGARQVRVVNRSPVQDQDAQCAYFALSQLAQACTDCDILINTTPLGMQGIPHDFETFAFLDALPSDAIVCDLLYKPDQTNLLVQAAARGLNVQNGLGMLIWQAFYAFRHFFDILPTPSDYAAVLSAVRQG